MKKTLMLVLFTWVAIFANSQEKKVKSILFAFYNTENFYDTINDPTKNDEEFLPDGPNHWNSEKYFIKVKHISEVIRDIGKDNNQKCPLVMGLTEIENRSILEELIHSEALKDCNYDIVHYDSPDKRGIDVGFLYQKDRFVVTRSSHYPLIVPDNPDFKTRDQLVVSGILDGEPFHFIINHWPSRYGGEKKSSPMREDAAQLCRHIVDSIYKTDSTAKIVIMGDLNDDPINKSVLKILGGNPTKEQTKSGELYNPMYELFKVKGVGSLAYNDKWNLFDQFIISYPLIAPKTKGYKFVKAGVFNKPYLVQKDGQFAGYPFRTYVGSDFMGGYSDHFPSFIILSK